MFTVYCLLYKRHGVLSPGTGTGDTVFSVLVPVQETQCSRPGTGTGDTVFSVLVPVQETRCSQSWYRYRRHGVLSPGTSIGDTVFSVLVPVQETRCCMTHFLSSNLIFKKAYI